MLVAKVDEIRHRRLEAGLSRERLSILAGLPSNSVFRIERGKVSYTYRQRHRIQLSAQRSDTCVRRDPAGAADRGKQNHGGCRGDHMAGHRI